MNNPIRYGEGDTTYQAAGGETGIRVLVDSFYDILDSDADFNAVRSMHPDNLEVSRDKLARFLCGWMGGPSRYREKYGPISITRAHAHLNVSEKERDQWLACMASALARQPYSESLVKYLLAQLLVPAESIRQVCSRS